MPDFGEFKQFLSDDSFRIQLYDSVHEYASNAIGQLSSDEESHPTKWDGDSLLQYLNHVQELTSDLRSVGALLGFWSPESHPQLTVLHTRHFSQWIGSSAANAYPRRFQWYPLLLQQYSLGLGAVASGSFKILRMYLESPFPDPRSQHLRVPSIVAVDSAFSDARQLFKLLPGREKQFTPLSEYLFEFFESDLQDVVFFGADYEYVFDRFEILYSLQYSHLNERLYDGRYWAPVGRFGWKFAHRVGPDPYGDLVSEASNEKDSWPPIIAGFFDGDFSRFEEVVSNFSDHLNRLGWH